MRVCVCVCVCVQWDLMGMWQRGEPLTEWSNEGLPETVVQQWTDNMTAWVRHVMSHVPYVSHTHTHTHTDAHTKHQNHAEAMSQ